MAAAEHATWLVPMRQGGFVSEFRKLIAIPTERAKGRAHHYKLDRSGVDHFHGREKIGQTFSLGQGTNEKDAQRARASCGRSFFIRFSDWRTERRHQTVFLRVSFCRQRFEHKSARANHQLGEGEFARLAGKFSFRVT